MTTISKNYLTIEIQSERSEIVENLIQNTGINEIEPLVLSYSTKDEIVFHTSKEILNTLLKNFKDETKQIISECREWTDFADLFGNDIGCKIMKTLNPNAEAWFSDLIDCIWEYLEEELKVFSLYAIGNDGSTENTKVGLNLIEANMYKDSFTRLLKDGFYKNETSLDTVVEFDYDMLDATCISEQLDSLYKKINAPVVNLMIHDGSLINVFNIKKEDVSKEAIILGACRINRFLGQTKYAYPVAAHLIGGYWYLEGIGASDIVKKQWLIHEAFESYSGVDLPSPLKAMLPDYKDAEKRALKVIAEALGIEPVESKQIKALDRSIMIAEAIQLMPNTKYWEEFAKEQNIIRLHRENDYVLSSIWCDEQTLKTTLTEIWNEVFSEDLTTNTKNYN